MEDDTHFFVSSFVKEREGKRKRENLYLCNFFLWVYFCYFVCKGEEKGKKNLFFPYHLFKKKKSRLITFFSSLLCIFHSLMSTKQSFFYLFLPSSFTPSRVLNLSYPSSKPKSQVLNIFEYLSLTQLDDSKKKKKNPILKL